MSEWISVKDRLPEDGDKCLCCVGWHNTKSYLICDYSEYLPLVSLDMADDDHEGFYKYDGEIGFYSVYAVTHWMPLPQPPEEVE